MTAKVQSSGEPAPGSVRCSPAQSCRLVLGNTRQAYLSKGVWLTLNGSHRFLLPLSLQRLELLQNLVGLPRFEVGPLGALPQLSLLRAASTRRSVSSKLLSVGWSTRLSYDLLLQVCSGCKRLCSQAELLDIASCAVSELQSCPSEGKVDGDIWERAVVVHVEL